MKKTKAFHLVTVFAVSALLLSAVNAMAETWFAWAYYPMVGGVWEQASKGVPFDSYESCIADWESVCKDRRFICTRLSGSIGVGEQKRDGRYPMYFHCFSESYDPRKEGGKR